MAEVFRPTYTVTDPATGKKTTRKSGRYWVRYYTSDGKRHKVKGHRDRKATEALAATLERRAARLAEGITDPSDEYAKRPLDAHLEDYRRYLSAKGNTADHVSQTEFHIRSMPVKPRKVRRLCRVVCKNQSNSSGE